LGPIVLTKDKASARSVNGSNIRKDGSSS